jgi:Predicted transcriptional regulators
VEPARSGCPINAAVEAFGDSWSLLVLRDVMFGNRRYFRELLAGSEGGDRLQHPGRPAEAAGQGRPADP